MNATPAGNEPHRPAPADGTLTPAAPGNPPIKPALKLTRPQKILTVVIGAGVLTIAALGFIGSYDAVTALAREKHFGGFARAFPIAVDAGIIAFLALDLLLTWLRMSYPLLRYGAWLLTAATISFNAATAYPDKLGMGMHGVIPILFVIAVEAARHAIGRIAEITADKHLESPPVSRWFLNPIGTFILWRRQRLWMTRKWDTVLGLEQERRIYVSGLRREHGRSWRRKANADQLLVVRLATKDGLSIAEAIERPQREAQKLAEAEANRQAEACAKTEAEAEAKHRAQLRTTEAEAKRRAEIAEAEAAEARARSEAEAAQAEAKYRAEAAEAEAKQRTEAATEVARLEVEAKRREDTEAARLLIAETEAKLAKIARTEQQATARARLDEQEATANARLAEQGRLAEQRRLQVEEQEMEHARAASAARARREADAHERAQRIARTASTSTSPTSTATPKQTPTSARTSTSVSPIGGPRAKRQTEVEKVLARLVEADDPKSYPLEDVMTDFDLKQTTAYDRLKTAQDLFAAHKTEADNPKSTKTA